MLTLQELKRIVKAPGCGEKTPTVKELCSAGVAAAEKILNGNAEITVYKNGYAVYRAGECTTVFSIYSCGGYSYGPDGSGHIEEQFFEQEAWYTRLVLEGEDRLERNREARKRGLEVSYSAVSEEWQILKASGSSALEQISREETMKEALAVLTKQQQKAAFRCLVEHKTQRQISKELGITVQAVSSILSRTASRLHVRYAGMGKKK